jgi:hypothetical protein
MKKLLRFICAAVLGLSAVSCYDDTALRATLDEHQAQLDAMNENIKSLETLIKAIDESDYVVSVDPLMENGKEVGYVIKFAKNGEIRIYHGKDGAAGKDGADGQDGNDGVDGADGKDGADGQDGDSIFKDIYEKDGYLYFVLTDGTTHKVPMSASAAVPSLDIVFDVEQGVALVPGNIYLIDYSIVGASGNTVVRVMRNPDFVRAAVKEITPSSGQLIVGIYGYYFDSVDDPDRDEPYFDDGSGDITREEYFRSQLTVHVSVSDDKTSIIKALNIKEGKIESVEDVYTIDAEGGQLKAYVKTDIEYEVRIPEDCNWLTYAPETKSSLRTDELVFSVAANDGDSRSVEVELADKFGYPVEWFYIEQKSNVISATCAEVIAGADGNLYRMKGVVTSITNTTYGNWYLDDGTGEIYIYGTLDKDGKSKNFASWGLKKGDMVECVGPKQTYGNTVELVDVTILNIESYQGSIIVDGDFSDWDELSVNDCYTVRCAPDAYYTALKEMKVYDDPYHIYVYFQFDPDQLDYSNVSMHIAFNSDGNIHTGGYNWWSDLCIDYLLESFIYLDNQPCPFESGIWAFDDEPNSPSWYWEEVAMSASGLGRSCVNGDRYELALSKAVLRHWGVHLAQTYGIGLDIEKDWDTVGLLPNADVTEENRMGASPMLYIGPDAPQFTK